MCCNIEPFSDLTLIVCEKVNFLSSKQKKTEFIVKNIFHIVRKKIEIISHDIYLRFGFLNYVITSSKAGKECILITTTSSVATVPLTLQTYNFNSWKGQ